jgi:hypothetical protein
MNFIAIYIGNSCQAISIMFLPAAETQRFIKPDSPKTQASQGMGSPFDGASV